MEFFWPAFLSCSGSVLTALIGAIGSIIVARINKGADSKSPREPVTSNTAPVEPRQIPETSKPIYVEHTISSSGKYSDSSISDRRAIVIGISSILIVMIASCTALALNSLNLDTPGTLCLSGIAIILGLIAILSRKKWAVNTAVIISGLIFIVQASYTVFWISMLIKVSTQPK